MDECTPWGGTVRKDGYGLVYRNGRRMLAHRAAYEDAHGVVLEPPQLIDHVCHNEDLSCPGGACPHRRCTNPSHLRIATARQNILGGRGPAQLAARERADTHCQNGHRYTPETTGTWDFSSQGQGRWRRCLLCYAARRQRANEQRRRRRSHATAA